MSEHEMYKLTDMAAYEVEDLYREAQEDWIGLWEFFEREVGSLSIPEAERDTVFQMVRALMGRGLLVGNLRDDGGLAPWAEQTPDRVIDRIRAEWDALGRAPSINEICWFGLPSRVRPTAR